MRARLRVVAQYHSCLVLSHKKMAATCVTGQTTLLLYFVGVAPLTGEKRPPPTTRRNPGASKHRRTGIDLSWASHYPWLVISEDDCGEQGMLCSICCKTNCRPIRVPLGKAVWVEVPCKTITQQSLKEHPESSCHKEAMHVESSCVLAKKQGGIAACFDTVVSVQKKGIHWTFEMYALSR